MIKKLSVITIMIFFIGMSIVSSTENIVENVVNIKDIESQSLCSDKRFYAVNAQDGYLIWFDPDDLSILNEIRKFPTSNFPAGGCFVKNTWWICDTQGNLFYINPVTGDIVSVGSSGTGELVDLAWDPETNTLWGVSTSLLYSIDIETGSATCAGHIDVDGLLWDIAADMNGNLWGLTLNSSGLYLYSIDTKTLNATQICNDIIIPVSEISYEKDEEVMWGINYNYTSSKSELWTIDINECTTTLVGTFSKNNQIVGLAIPYTFSNKSPTEPLITGPKSGSIGTEYEWTFVSTDPEEEYITYYIDFGDQCCGGDYYGPYSSEEEVTIPHTYTSKDTFVIKALAIDENGAESNISSYVIIIPRNKASCISSYLKYLNKYPLFQDLFDFWGRILRLRSC